jgi:hypothetical protein
MQFLSETSGIFLIDNRIYEPELEVTKKREIKAFNKFQEEKD